MDAHAAGALQHHMGIDVIVIRGNTGQNLHQLGHESLHMAVIAAGLQRGAIAHLIHNDGGPGSRAAQGDLIAEAI